jgi:uncharacterized phiE125 gp8 family phage protein
MNTKLITPPAVEPVELQDVKDFARVDNLEDDDMLSSLLMTAREAAELITRRAFLTQTWRLTAYEFPRGLGNGIWRFGGRNSKRCEIALPYPPLQSVTSIEYLDSGGVLQTMDPADYIVHTDSEPGRITLPELAIWPVTAWVADAVTITFVAGYGDSANDLPASVKTYIKMKTARLYDGGGDPSTEDMLKAILSPLLWGSYS